MEYIKECDYQYIMNKYHNQSKPFDSFRRFVRNDEIFDTESGMEADKIFAGLMQLDEKSGALSHPIRKAKAFEYVLHHTKISCDKRDPFPAIHMIDRPFDKILIAPWKKEVFHEILPEVEAKRVRFEKTGLAAVSPDFDHSVPYWERIFSLGFKGLLTESEKARFFCLKTQGKLDREQEDFYEGIRITYHAILCFLERLAEQAEKQDSLRMAKALRNIKEEAPRTFYEALLVDYIYFILSEHIEGLQVRSLSNFDRLFYDFYTNDLNNGITEREIRTDLAYFFLQFTAIGNYWNQPVYLGGCREDESTEINELSYLFLDVYDKMNIYNPKIQIKIADSTPKDFILKALDMIRRGNNCIVFVNDATIRKALEKIGVSREEARLCNVKGCYEYLPRGSMEPCMNYFNLLKPLEYALHQGCDGITGEFMGLKSPDIKDYKNFEDLLGAYKKQLRFAVEQIMEVVNSFEDYLSYINPQSMLSATYPACIAQGKDALCGGAATNGSAIMFGFMADLADSLTAIKKYVFEKKRLSLSEYVKMLDNNYEENEKFRKELLNDRDKYGNNKEIPDSLVKEIAHFLCEVVCGKENARKRGGAWNMGFHVARMSYRQANITATSPTGRLKGEELSKNLSASMGMNREGATAAILSVTKVDATAFTGDACLDLGLLPSTVKGTDGLEAMYGLLMTFMKRKGHALHINVFDADTLRAAQKEPEKYKDLQIRVCGWNVLFNNISKEEQDGFIKQAEGLV